MTFSQEIRPRLHEGDCWLYAWRADWIQTAPENTQLIMETQYEDRSELVREVLSANSLESALAIASKLLRIPVSSIAGLRIGQEEDRATGYPIRIVQIAFLDQETECDRL